MRCAGMGILLLLAAGARADRIILVPTATKLLHRQVRLEYGFDPYKADRYDTWLGVGLTKDVEVEVQMSRYGRLPDLGTFNVSYLYVTPIVDTGPGVAIGMQDVMNRTPNGRMAYLALTYRLGLDGAYNSKTPLELTAGFGLGERNGIFAGVQLPFTWQFRGLFEHDRHRATAGLEFRPFHGIALRMMWRDQETLLSARYVARF